MDLTGLKEKIRSLAGRYKSADEIKKHLIYNLKGEIS